ncbi:MAG TPA: DegT/DnrJ/EryC1/StrS family aminotransferase [Saprospiraceae bacterium]|nr:DegT/DnrJ/EryC1/StrS family aminotransferase [Saprospiraceae bacterium]
MSKKIKSEIHIPLVDLVAQYKGIRKEIDKAIKGVVEKGKFIGGEEVKKFAVEFANIANTPFCVPCANGTDAIEIALTILGIRKGDEVIIPALSFVATLEAVCNVGAKPVLCDIDPERMTMDALHVKKLITEKTKAIIPVHLYGQMADMDPLMKLCKQHNLYLIEDAAQSHKAEYKGFHAGSMGDFGTFSFFPGKNLGAYGDAGAITMNDEEFHNKAFKMANHGRISKYDHESVGRNSRLDTLQAAILSVKAKHLEDWIKTKRKIAERYDNFFAQLGKDFPKSQIRWPKHYPESKSVYHLYVIRVDQSIRDGLRSFLESAGIETGVHYPIALSKLKVTTDQLKIRVDCPESEKASKEVISIPIYPELTKYQQGYICYQINKYFSASTELSTKPSESLTQKSPKKKKS